MENELQNLGNLSKERLIEIILSVNEKNEKLKDDYQKIINLRLYHLERDLNMSLQYSRRDTIEITGIPPVIEDQDLEKEVIEIFRDAKVVVDKQPIKASDIQACHRLNKKGKTIIKVVNRKFVEDALRKGKHLKGNKRFGVTTQIYLNDSFCPEFGFLNYAVRRAKKKEVIFAYKVRNGITHVQKNEGGKYVQIGHVIDLENLGIEIPPRN